MEKNTEAKKHTLKDWIIVTRPWSFTASSLPVVVGYAALWRMGMQPDTWVAVWLMLNIVAIHAAGNVWSDCSDYEKGVDRPGVYAVETLTSGLFQVKELRRFSLTLMAISLFSGILMSLFVDIRLLWLGLTGGMLSVFYPWMKYRAMGDLNILLCYGVLPALAVGVAACHILRPHLLLFVMPVALITLSILHANNMRDVNTDREAGINTLCMTLGSGCSTLLYALELIIPYLWVLCLDWRAALPVLLTLPLAARNIRLALQAWSIKNNTPLASLDQLSAQLQLLFAALFSIGLGLSTWMNW